MSAVTAAANDLEAAIRVAPEFSPPNLFDYARDKVEHRKADEWSE